MKHLLYTFWVITTFTIVAIGNVNSYEAVDDYATRPEVVKLISVLNKNAGRCLTYRNKKFCKQGKKSIKKGTGWCYRYVKLGLLKSGMTSQYIGGGSAKQAGPYLEEEGFVNILASSNKSPVVIPPGSIFVYSTPWNVHGHIEVKIDEDKFISDHIREKTNGKLLGIYIKIFEGVNNASNNMLYNTDHILFHNFIYDFQDGRKHRACSKWAYRYSHNFCRWQYRNCNSGTF